MTKALTGEGILWLTRVCQGAWRFGKTPRDWQTGVIILIFKKGDRKQCTAYAECLKSKCRDKARYSRTKTGEDGQYGFCSGRSTLHFESNLQEILGYGKDLFACFVDLEKAHDRVSRDKFRKVLQGYGVDG